MSVVILCVGWVSSVGWVHLLCGRWVSSVGGVHLLGPQNTPTGESMGCRICMIHLYTHAHIHTCTQMYTHAHKCTHMHTYTHAHKCTQNVHTYTHTQYINTLCACTYTHKFKHMCILCACTCTQNRHMHLHHVPFSLPPPPPPPPPALAPALPATTAEAVKGPVIRRAFQWTVQLGVQPHALIAHGTNRQFVQNALCKAVLTRRRIMNILNNKKTYCLIYYMRTGSPPSLLSNGERWSSSMGWSGMPKRT